MQLVVENTVQRLFTSDDVWSAWGRSVQSDISYTKISRRCLDRS